MRVNLFLAALFLVCFCMWGNVQAEEGGVVRVPPPPENTRPHYPESEPQSLREEPLSFMTHDGRTIKLNVEIATQRAELTKGLMYRKDVPEGTGMLFVFGDLDIRKFWMKNTYVPLDMVFIDGKGKIINIHEMAKPFDLTPIASSAPAIAVLEIGGGMAHAYGLSVGDGVQNKTLSQAISGL